MNTSDRSRVRARIARMAATVTILVALGGHGCAEIDGGAVDLSWTLERLDGRRVEQCIDARVDKIRLGWGGEGEYHEWNCEDRTAVTRFDIPSGERLFWVTPICVGGQPADAATYEAPAPIARTIEAGEVVTLNTVLIMVNTDCSGCACICASSHPTCSTSTATPVTERQDSTVMPIAPLRASALPARALDAILLSPGA